MVLSTPNGPVTEMILTISEDLKKLLIYSKFLHQYFEHLLSIAGLSGSGANGPFPTYFEYATSIIISPA